MQPSVGSLLILGLSFCLGVNAVAHVRRDEVSIQNGKDAIALNDRYKTLTPTSPCNGDEVACVNNTIAKCVGGSFTLEPAPCSGGLSCRASPNRGSSGTTTGCMGENEYTRRMLATGLEYTPPPEDPSQSSLTLDPDVISDGFKNDGFNGSADPIPIRSRTSSNNWINFCNTANKPLTNGLQNHTDGSCNPAPMGVLPSRDHIPSAKFIFPPNFKVLTKNVDFTVEVAVRNLDTGWFTNANTTFMSGPQELDSNGLIMGHSHIVIQKLEGFYQTTPPDPTQFVRFQGLNTPATPNDVLSVVVKGLDVGFYRIAVFHTGANHQPIAVPIAQRGALGDMVYFSVA